MACRPVVCREPAPHQVHVAHIDHGGTRLGCAVIVRAVAPSATMPGVGTRHYPAFRSRRDACGPLRTRLDLEAPRWAMCCPPRLENMRGIRVIGHDRVETGTGVRSTLWEPCRGRHASSQPRPRDHPGQPQAQGIDDSRPLAPVDLLAAIIAALGPAPLRRCDRWAVDARRTRCGLSTRWPAGRFSPGLQPLGPRASVAPPRTVIVHGPLGQDIVREPSPLATASIQRQQRLDHGAPVHGAWASPALGVCHGPQRCQNRPRFGRQLGGRRFPCRRVLGPDGTLLDPYGEGAHGLIHQAFWQVAFPDSL